MNKSKQTPKRRARNPENLYQRNGLWFVRYKIGHKLIRRSLGTKNLREAKRLRDQILGKRTAAAKFGIDSAEAEPCKTFAQVAELWLASRQADESLAPHTRYQNTRVTQNLLIPEFGSMAMAAITTEDIERFVAGLRKKHKRSTVANYFACFRTIIRQAIRRGWYTGMNPLDRLDRVPTYGPGRDTALTVDEAQHLLAELSGRLYYKVALALYVGLRWGEVHGLAWLDIQLDAETSMLTVARSYHGKPKNEASAATVPISSDAAALLRRWRTEQNETSQWVFPGVHGDILAHSSYPEACKIHDAAERVGIHKHVTPHVFRHSFGTWVYERTGDPKIVQRLMRHASFQTSMGYVHDNRSLAAFVNKLPTLISTNLKAI